MIVALVSTALANTQALEPTAETPLVLETQSMVAVFEDVPDKKLRLKAIRYAMRKSDAIVGGRDWGRVLCFNFNGGTDAALIETALKKARIEGMVRDAENCDRPPQEAFLPPKAKASLLVRVPEDAFTESQSELAALLDLDIGVSAVRVQNGVVDRMCLEFDREPDPVAVDAAVQTLTADVQTESVDDCADALKPAE